MEIIYVVKNGVIAFGPDLNFQINLTELKNPPQVDLNQSSPEVIKIKLFLKSEEIRIISVPCKEKWNVDIIMQPHFDQTFFDRENVIVGIINGDLIRQ